jgi:hypothetical protein
MALALLKSKLALKRGFLLLSKSGSRGYLKELKICVGVALLLLNYLADWRHEFSNNSDLSFDQYSQMITQQLTALDSISKHELKSLLLCSWHGPTQLLVLKVSLLPVTFPHTRETAYF